MTFFLEPTGFLSLLERYCRRELKVDVKNRNIYKYPELYPFVKTEKPDKFRGKLKLYPEKCIGCRICMKDCPSNAITITKKGEKQFEAVVDLSKCIYCAQCVDSCLKKALEVTPAVGEALERKVTDDELNALAVKQGMISVAAHGMQRASAGETTVEEVLRFVAR
jgi:formate hydrogenlyase subunit 6/NADH:ubiquinone oxidoreductase subunit I